MKLSNPDAVSVYTVSGGAGKSLPDWLSRQRKRSLKEDEEYQNRVELLQDFHFESASQCVRVSDDGNWVMSTGTYVFPQEEKVVCRPRSVTDCAADTSPRSTSTTSASSRSPSRATPPP